jgi:hypothetical protein
MSDEKQNEKQTEKQAEPEVTTEASKTETKHAPRGEEPATPVEDNSAEKPSEEKKDRGELMSEEVKAIEGKYERAKQRALERHIEQEVEAENRVRTVPRRYSDQHEILGSYVRDRVSRFEGIVIARVVHLTGCNRVAIQSGKEHNFFAGDRPLPPTIDCDEAACEVLAWSEYKPDGTAGSTEERDRGPAANEWHPDDISLSLGGAARVTRR